MKIAGFLLANLALASAAPQFQFNDEQYMPYEFSYGVNDQGTGDVKEHKQTATASGRTEGEFRWLQPNGLYRVTRYFVDGDGGYQATVSEEPGDNVANYYFNSLGNVESSGGSQAFTSSSQFSSNQQGFGSSQVLQTRPDFSTSQFTGSQQTFGTSQSSGTSNQGFSSFQNQQNTQIVDGGVINGGFVSGDIIDGGFVSGGNSFLSGVNSFNQGSTGFQSSSGNSDINRGVAVILAGDSGRNSFQG